ncbi:hypothetical protein DL98DRAFT_625833, partial [Cadophora sp. DSE1049]
SPLDTNTKTFSTPDVLRRYSFVTITIGSTLNDIKTQQLYTTMSPVPKKRIGNKQSTKGKKQKTVIKKWPITFLHGHKSLEDNGLCLPHLTYSLKREQKTPARRYAKSGVEMVGVFWLGWSYRTWKPVSSLRVQKGHPTRDQSLSLRVSRAGGMRKPAQEGCRIIEIRGTCPRNFDASRT